VALCVCKLELYVRRRARWVSAGAPTSEVTLTKKASGRSSRSLFCFRVGVSEYDFTGWAIANRDKSAADPCTRFFLWVLRFPQSLPQCWESCRAGFRRYSPCRKSFRGETGWSEIPGYRHFLLPKNFSNRSLDLLDLCSRGFGKLRPIHQFRR